MKKIIVALMLMFACCTTMFGQFADSHNIPTHSLTLQVSDGIGEIFVDAFVAVFGAAAEAIVVGTVDGLTGSDSGEVTKWQSTSLTPYMTLGYDYHFPETRWNVGGEFGYWQSSYKSVNKDPVQTRKISFGSIVGTSKFFYKPNGTCKLYGGVNLGVFACGSLNGEPGFLPAFQINPIGMRLGNEHIAFVSELGIGYKGILQVGVNIGL